MTSGPRMLDRSDVGSGPPGDEVVEATRPARAADYRKWWKVWLPIPLLFVLFDVTFNFYFWRIPKLTGQSDDYSYQFLYDLHDLQTRRPTGVRVLAFGSSVAGAFDPYQIDGLLERDFPGEEIEVARLMQPGMKPSDYRLLWSLQLKSIDFDVAVVVFNLVDFLNPSFERNLKPQIRYVLPPWRTLLARYPYIPRFGEKVEMALASVSSLFRYRKLLRSALRDHVKLVRSWWRGGVATPYGVYPDGFTKPRFGVPFEPEVEYFVDPAWIEQRGVARLVFSHRGRVVARHQWRDPGWKRDSLEVSEDGGGILHGVVEGGWSPRAAGRLEDSRLLGPRLRKVPDGDHLDGRRPPLRYPPVEPYDVKPFLRMGAARGGRYADAWRRQLEADSDFANRFRIYRDEKKEVASRPFEPTGEFEQLREVLYEIAATGREVLMVNTPESPLLEDVVDGEFYAGYLAFFHEIAAADPRLSFVDLHDALPPEEFNDWHHINYVGQLAIGPTLSERLNPLVASALRRGGVGLD